MGSDQRGLMVRRTERREVALPAEVCVAPQHATAVRLAAGAGHREGWVEAGLVDLSSRGIGLVTEVFLPRGSRVRVRVLEPVPEGDPRIVADCSGRIARVIMTDRRPGYMLGVALGEISDEQAKLLDELIERFADADGGEGGDA